jgi:hypothetical protein
MGKRLAIFIVFSLLLGLVGLPIVSASEVNIPKVPSGPAGKSHVAHLYLFEKDPSN